MKDFYEAWWYLSNHPNFEHPEYENMMPAFPASLYIEVVKVDPDTLTIEDDSDKNTLTQVWLECGGWEWAPDTEQYETCHNPDLDTGGDTFEDAIIALANLLDGIDMSAES